jgi:hypothetical protein
MGKRSRLERRREEKIKVDDAAETIAAIRMWADAPPQSDPGGEWIQGVAKQIMAGWNHSPVALRADAEFVGALLNSNTDVELVPDWLKRFPFNAVAFTLPEPVSLHDGHRVCHYRGMIVRGINNRITSNAAAVSRLRRPDGGAIEHVGVSHTSYVNIPTAQGVRCLWVYGTDDRPGFNLQTVTLILKGDLANTNLQDLIEAQIYHVQQVGRSGGDELATLIPLTLELLLYTAATDPEIDWPPSERISRPHQMRNTRVGNLGWRVGATLRQARQRPASSGATSDLDDGAGQYGLGGWRLPPHIRKAHWHRVRMAERNQFGDVIGNRSGIEGIDWHYELRWYPPAAVNANPDAAPTVREL